MYKAALHALFLRGERLVFFAIHYIYGLTNQIGGIFPRVKNHAVHGEKTTTHLVENSGPPNLNSAASNLNEMRRSFCDNQCHFFGKRKPLFFPGNLFQKYQHLFCHQAPFPLKKHAKLSFCRLLFVILASKNLSIQPCSCWRRKRGKNCD